MGLEPANSEPRLVGMLCHWCSYSAADGAAAARLPLPSALRTLRVMCTGRIDPTLVIHALSRGADGVLICGCHPGDCHYIRGNCQGLARFLMLKEMLVTQGLEPERLRFEFVSAQESQRYADLTNEMAETLQALPPLHWQKSAPAMFPNAPGGEHG